MINMLTEALASCNNESESMAVDHLRLERTNKERNGRDYRPGFGFMDNRFTIP